MTVDKVPQEDHYIALGLHADASAEQVKKAYRTLSKVYHPDKGVHLGENEKQENEKRMVQLNCAYQVLMSPRQRLQYDLSRPAAPKPGNPVSRRVASCGPMGSSQISEPGGHGIGLQSWVRRRQNHTANANASGSTWDHSGRPPTGGSSTSSSGSLQRGPVAATPRNSCSNPSSAARDGVSDPAYPRVTANLNFGGTSKPRYQCGGKYTSSARQARRMDPGQYTTHVDGRAAEFVIPPGTRPPHFNADAAYGNPLASYAGSCANVPTGLLHTPTAKEACIDLGVASTERTRKLTPEQRVSDSAQKPPLQPPPGPVKNPTWLQRQIDIAKEWEDVRCTELPDEKGYEWSKASRTWTQNMKERRLKRQQGAEEPGSLPPEWQQQGLT